MRDPKPPYITRPAHVQSAWLANRAAHEFLGQARHALECAERALQLSDHWCEQVSPAHVAAVRDEQEAMNDDDGEPAGIIPFPPQS